MPGPLWLPVTDESDFVGPVMVAGDGDYLIDSAGNRYLSASSGLWNVALGYSQDIIRQAIVDQVSRLPYGTLFRYRNQPALHLAEELVRITAARLTDVVYSCSGASAVDTAVKAVRKYWHIKGQPQRKVVIAFDDGYHGLTSGAMALSSTGLDQADYGVDDRFTRRIPFPTPETVDDVARDLRQVLDNEGDQVAGLIFEPVQGTGCRPMPATFGRFLERLRGEFPLLLIADEVTTGFGRTGTLFACEWLTVEPDVLVLAKAINSGYLPLAATLLTREIRQAFTDADVMFWNGETEAGNPIACAAALATIRMFEECGLPASARGQGQLLGRELGLLAGVGRVSEVRGQGFMWGLELLAGGAPPTSAELWGMVKAAMAQGVLLHPIRSGLGVMPPLTVTPGEVAEIVRVVGLVTRAA